MACMSYPRFRCTHSIEESNMVFSTSQTFLVVLSVVADIVPTFIGLENTEYEPPCTRTFLQLSHSKPEEDEPFTPVILPPWMIMLSALEKCNASPASDLVITGLMNITLFILFPENTGPVPE